MGWGAAWGSPWGGSSSAAASIALANPQIRLLLEVELGTLPLELPAVLGSGPLMVSTEDRYVPALARARRLQYVAEVLADNPVGYWRLNDQIATLAQARVGLDMTLGNTPAINVAGALVGDSNAAMTFAAASSQYGSVPADAAWSIASGDSFTLECWVKFATAPASNRFILMKRQGGSAGSPYYQLAIDTSGRADFFVRGTGGGEGGIDAVANLAGAAFHHVVAVRDVATDSLLLYVDGRLRRRGTDPSVGDLATLNPLWAACHAITTPIGQFLDGSMDELAFYRTALPADRIEAHYQAGAFNAQSLFARRLIDVPTVSLSGTDLFGALPAIESLTARMLTKDPYSPVPDLSAWHTAKVLYGKRARAHLLDVDTGAIAQNVFVGVLANVAQPDLHTTVVTFQATDVARMSDELPRLRVTSSDFPDAPEFGAFVPLGVGVQRRVSCPALRGRSGSDETLQTFSFTASAATNELTLSPALDLDILGTGDGPVYLSSSGTLPGGLEANRPYWLIASSATVVLLALSPGDALADVPQFVDLIDAGAGVHTLTFGRPAQLDDVYDVGVGTGNLGVVEVEVGGAAVLEARQVVSPSPNEDPGFIILHREYQPEGRALTALRFEDNLHGVDIRATVQRVYPDIDPFVLAEWKFLHGFQDALHGFDGFPGDSLGASTLTTAALTRGPNPLGWGAIALDGVGDYLETPFADALVAQTFTLETWIRVRAGANIAGSIVTGPGSDVTGSVDNPGWLFSHNPLSKKVSFQWRTGVLTIQSVSTPANILEDVWLALAAVCEPARIRLYLNGVKVADAVKPAIVWPTNTGRGMIFGRIFTGTPPTRFRGSIGYTRLSSVARTDREILQAYYLMRRNPIEALRLLEAEAGVSQDDASYDQAAAIMDAVQGGAVHADGVLRAPKRLEVIRQEFVPFRDLRFGLNGLGRQTVSVSAPQTTTGGLVLEVGGAANNVVEYGGRVRASLFEAVKELPVLYRIDETGAGLFLTRNVFAEGRRADVLRLEWVDDPVTADICACLRAKHLRTWDELLSLTAGHDARTATDGRTLTVRCEALSIARAYLALRAFRWPSVASLALVPYDAADWDYEAGTLPPETLPLFLKRLDLGANPTLVVSKSGNVLTAEVRSLHTETLRPRANGPIQQLPNVVGAPTAWQALLEDPADEDASYAATLAGNGELLAYLTPPAKSLSRINAITLRARVRKTTTAPAFLQLLMRNAALEVRSPPGVGFATLTTSFADYAQRMTASPFTGQAWTLAEINALAYGVQIVGVDPVRVTQLEADYEATEEAPELLGRVDVWRVGPSASQPALPAETDAPTTWGTDLRVTWQETLAAGTHWFWARVYDRGDRLVALIGPTSIVV